VTAIALRSLGARKFRAALTSLAIVLGVTMVAGTYILTDTISQSFNEIFTKSNAGTDVIVQGKQAVDTEDGTAPPIQASLLAKVRKAPGVALAAGAIADPQVQIIGSDGEPRGGNGAPTFGFSNGPKRFNPLDYVAGGAPKSDDQVTIDKATADAEGFDVGDEITIAGKQSSRKYEVSGIATLAGTDSFGGATLALFTLPEAQRITDKQGKFDQITVAADEGTTPSQLASNVKSVLPAKGAEVETGEQNIQDQRDDVGQFIGFLKTALFIFAGVSLFVAAFLIFNTFSITVAQRTREFALLRTLGANRRQIVSSVALEALIMGLLASAVGLLAGVGFAPGATALLKSGGIDLPSTGSVIETRTIVVSLLLGTTLAVLSALVPALRATRVPPVTGLREGAVLETAAGRGRRFAVGVVLATLGVLAMLLGVFSALTPGEVWVGVGAGAMFLGVALLSPQLVAPLASIVGRPLERLRGAPGRIARENAIRNPGRTASTAAALMIGLALVTFVTVFAAGIKGSINDAIDKTFTGDLILSNNDGFSDIPVKSADAIKGIEGVGTVSVMRFTQGKLVGQGKTGDLTLIEPKTAAQVLDLDWRDGSQDLLSSMGPGDAVVDTGFASDNDLATGDTFTELTPSGRKLDYTVTGTFKDNTDFIGDFAASGANAAAYDEASNATNVVVGLAPGSDLATVRGAIDGVIAKQFPTVQTQDQGQLKDSISEQLNGLLGVVYALLLLTVIVSLFGIVNTLALSIHERTRELGLLRAIGTSRRQVRRIVRYEAVITAMIGAVLGTILGVVFAIVVSRPLADDGFILTIPVGTLLLLLVLAALAGVLAAIGPARRASRLDVLEALAYE
jgi:putative ABC transport system permease protein